VELENLREEIKKTDLEILGLMKRRLDLAKEVGLQKIMDGKDVIDPSVEEAVIGRYRTFAEENGMDPDRTEEMCKILIEESVILQKSLR
jgi:chorismate mutase